MKQCNSHTSSDAKGLRGPVRNTSAISFVRHSAVCHRANVYFSGVYNIPLLEGCQARKLKRSKIDKMEIIPRLLLRPPNGRKHASAFFNYKKLIGGDASQLLLQATGP